MVETTLLNSGDWNSFWKQDHVHKKMSWSKKRIIRILKLYLKKSGTVLDAGCGSGFFSKFFCDQNQQTVSLDYSQEALSIAKEMTGGRARLIQADLLKEGMSANIKERFDLIFSDGLFEHFNQGQQARIMNNFSELLKDDGVVITFVPNQWSPWQIIRPFYMPGIKEEPFVLSQLVKIHEKAGLKIIQKGGINTVPFVVSPDRLLGYWLGMILFVVARKV